MVMVYGNYGDAKIKNLYSFLRKQDADKIVIRTTYCMGGWHDNEFDANAAGYNIYRIRYPEWEAKHEFSEAYELIRKK